MIRIALVLGVLFAGIAAGVVALMRGGVLTPNILRSSLGDAALLTLVLAALVSVLALISRHRRRHPHDT